MDLFGNLNSFVNDIKSGDAARITRAGFTFGNPILSPIIDIGNRLKQGHVDSRYLNNDGDIKKELVDVSKPGGGVKIDPLQQFIYGFGQKDVKERAQTVGTETFKRDFGDEFSKLKGRYERDGGNKTPKQLREELGLLQSTRDAVGASGLSYEQLGIGRGEVVQQDALSPRINDAVKEHKLSEREDNLGLNAGTLSRGQRLEAIRKKELAQKFGPGITTEDGTVKGTKQLEAESAADAQRLLLKAKDESASGKADIALTKQQIGESQSNIATNQFNMDFKLAQQAENTRRYNLEYGRDDYRDKRNFAFEKHKYSTNRADNIRRDNQQLDLRMFELELQKEMSEDARQQGMIQNLVGGLFSLGSLL